jgi:type I restriction enzyme S subunit
LNTRCITAVDCTIVRPIKICCSEYLVQYLSSKQYFKEVETCLAGGTRQRIGRSDLASFFIPFPHDIAEQKKIGSFFRALDHLITLHQRKLEKLKKIKASCLEKMFV